MNSSRFQRLYVRAPEPCCAPLSPVLESPQPLLPRGGSRAPLRIFLPRLQEALLDGLVARRLRGGGGPLPALRQPGHRAVLVGLQRHHVEEECLILVRDGCTNPGQLTL